MSAPAIHATIQRVDQYRSMVTLVVAGNVRIDMGILNDSERCQLARMLMYAGVEIARNNQGTPI